MKTIILIQTLIIIVGGYYIYNLNQATKVSEKIEIEDSGVKNEDANVRKGYTPPTENPPILDVSTTTETKGQTGYNDAGMEFPSLEEDYPGTTSRPESR